MANDAVKTEEKTHITSSCIGILHNYALKYAVIRFVVRCFITCSLSSIRLLGQPTSAAVAFVGTSGPGLGGVSALIGACIGYGILCGIEQGLQYMAASIVVYTAAYVCQYLNVYKKTWFMPCVVMIVVGLTLAFGAVSAERDTYSLYPRLILELFSSGGLSFLFQRALSIQTVARGKVSWEDLCALHAVVAPLIVCLSSVYFVEIISIGRVVAILFIMTSSFSLGRTYGIASAFEIGLFCELFGGAEMQHMLLYGLPSLAVSVVNTENKALYSLICFCGYLSALIIHKSAFYDYMLIIEFFAAAVLFLILPLQKVRSYSECNDCGYREIESDEFLRYKADKIRVIKNLFSTWGAPDDDQDVANILHVDTAEIFDSITEQLCARCEKFNVCWNNHYIDLIEIFEHAGEKSNQRGRIERSDFPDYFHEYCNHSDTFVKQSNVELRKQNEERKKLLEEREKRGLINLLYQEFSNVLDNISFTLTQIEENEAEVAVLVDQYLSVIGADCKVNAFRRRNGRLFLVLQGKKLRKLVRRKNYLDELSRVIGVRLCVESDFSKRECLVLMEAEPLAIEIGVASRRKSGERICGDCYSYFKTDEGKLCVILSDGLGSGEFAYDQSKNAVTSLEHLLLSGVHPMAAMNLLNVSMCLKGCDPLKCATIDMLVLDLFTGNADIYKLGASPTYIVAGERVVQISGTDFSAGVIQDNLTMHECAHMRLMPGNVIVMATDGVVFNDLNSMKSLLSEEKNNMKLFARSALKNSEKNCAAMDDMTVLTISVQKRN